VGGVSVEHPSWCYRKLCSVRTPNGSGYHRSRLAVLDPDPRTELGVTVQLALGTPIPGYPESGSLLVDLTLYQVALDKTDVPQECTLTLPANRAAALGYLLFKAGREMDLDHGRRGTR
jgi:hypothetical protein